MNYKKYAFLLSLIPLVLSGCGVTSSSEDVTSMPSTSIESSQPLSETYWDVTFDLNKVDAGEVANQTILHNGKVTRPNYTYPHEDDVFLGWFKDQYALVSWNFNVERVTSNLTLFGGWQSIIDSYNPGTSEPGSDYDYYDSDFFPTTYTVSFNANYDGGSIIEKTVTENSLVRAPSINRIGYRLENWYLEPDMLNIFDFSTPVTQSFNLYAKWVALTSYTVTFDYNYDGAPSPQNVTAYQGMKVARPTNPVRTNYDFIGWYKDRQFNEVWNFNADLINGDITLYARWSRLPLPGVYVVVSDAWAEDNARFVLWHGTSTLNKDGVATGVPNEYYFDNAATNYLALKRYVGTTMVGQVHSIASNGGWGQSWNQILVKAATPKVGSLNSTEGNYIELVMRDNSVDENLTTYTVTFDFNYDGAPTSQTKVVLAGQTVTAVSPTTRSGYDFVGWSIHLTGDPLYNFTTPVSENLHLYAIWHQQDPSTQVTITFNYNYAGSPANFTQTATIGGLITEPTGISRSGYTLQGWYLEVGTVTKWNFASDLVTAAMTLYAKWTENVVPTNNGVYVLVNSAWAQDNATFELEYTSSPNGRRTVVGVATTTPNEYFFEEIPLNAMILMRKVGGVQKAKIYNIAAWVQSGADYRNFGTTWNRVIVNPSLANNVPNEPATNAVTYDLRPTTPASSKLPNLFVFLKENAYENQ